MFYQWYYPESAQPSTRPSGVTNKILLWSGHIRMRGVAESSVTCLSNWHCFAQIAMQEAKKFIHTKGSHTQSHKIIGHVAKQLLPCHYLAKIIHPNPRLAWLVGTLLRPTDMALVWTQHYCFEAIGMDACFWCWSAVTWWKWKQTDLSCITIQYSFSFNAFVKSHK